MCVCVCVCVYIYIYILLRVTKIKSLHAMSLQKKKHQQKYGLYLKVLKIQKCLVHTTKIQIAPC